jgi:hypothetical protein
MWSAFIFGVAGFVFLGTTIGFGQAAADPWLISANGEKGSINAQTTRQDLIRAYKAGNVVDQDVDVGDGEIKSETILFANDPERRLEILWKDPEKKTQPVSARIRGRSSRWHTVHGISLGTTSTELEHLNGRSFRLTLMNDGTDMADESISWHGGLLEKEFQGDGRVILWLISSSGKDKRTGPHDFARNSDEPVMRARNFHISEITWVFPSKIQP